MGSNGNPDSEPVVNQPAETTHDQSTTEPSRADPSQTTQPDTSNPNPADSSNMNDTPDQQKAQTSPPTQPPSDEPTKETLPESADKETPTAPTEAEEAHKTLSHTESLEPKFSSTAIGPSSDQPDPSSKETTTDESGPALEITLLLTTGARHPFKIDGKYLRKRSVNVDNNDPFSMSVYTLKELIWREWRPGNYMMLF